MRWSGAILLLVLAGCSSLYNPYDSGSYVVRSGDTLFSIAWRHGVDARELARWNGIANPDRIYAGQRLVLGPPAGTSRVAASDAGATAGGNTGSSTTARAGATAAASRPPAAAAGPMPRWQWPVSGRIVARFGDPRVLSTGVGIGGRLGQDIRAAAAGRVVYVGGGLPDYGQLVIIEHNDSWLSAYGHNQRVIVGQGQQVAGGEKIAEMGPGPGGEPRLHFEIRRNGDPLDPLGLLPASG
jgi:lipoprotein NlpD